MDAYTITAITRKPFSLDLNSIDEEGQPVVFTQIKVALLAPRTGPTAATAWRTLDHDADGATVWISGHAATADPDDFQPAAPAGGVLWAYPVGTAVDPTPIVRFVYGP